MPDPGSTTDPIPTDAEPTARLLRVLRVRPVELAQALAALTVPGFDLASLVGTGSSANQRAALGGDVPSGSRAAVPATAGRAAAVACLLVPGTRWASVAVLRGAGVEVRATHPRAAELERHQHDSGVGPADLAARTRRPVRLAAGELRARWPAVDPEGDGVRGVLCLPLLSSTEVLGTLTLYGGEGELLDDDALDAAGVLADVVGGILERLLERGEPAPSTQGRHSRPAAHDRVAAVVTPAGRNPGAGTAAGDTYYNAFMHAPLGMALTDVAGGVVAVNDALCELLGAGREDLVGGTVLDAPVPDDRDRALAACASLAQPDETAVTAEVRLRRRGGEPFEAAVATAKVLGSDGPTHLVMHVEDVTERRALLDQLRRDAVHDSLTGLPNRVLLLDRLAHATSRHRRDNSPMSVLYLDLDGFKAVNDTYGHAAGDHVLSAVARLLEHHVRPGDTVARVGGDEFVVLCDDTDEAGALGLAGRLAHALAAPRHLPFGTVHVSASIGVATSRGPSPEEPLALLSRADLAMYESKYEARPGRLA